MMNNKLTLDDVIKSNAYCYLNKIYSYNGHKLFELAISNIQFTKNFIAVVDLENLVRIRQLYHKIKFDFEIKDGFLRSYNVPQSICPPSALKLLNKVMEINVDNKYNFFTFLNEAILNQFYFIGEEEDDISIPFQNINFSKSTMTSYMKLYSTKSTVRNQSIYFLNDDYEYNFKPFKFAVPVEYINIKKEWGEPIRKINLSEKWYNVYSMEFLSLISEPLVILPALINKANSVAYLYKNLINLYTDLMSVYSVKEVENIKWAGNSNSHKKVFGVFFKLNAKDITKARRKELLNLLVDYVEKNNSGDDIEYINKQNELSLVEKMCCYNIINLLRKYENKFDLINALAQQRNYLKKYLVFSEMYLYKIRTYLYFTQTMPTQFNNHILQGSEEHYTTIWKGDYYVPINRNEC